MLLPFIAPPNPIYYPLLTQIGLLSESFKINNPWFLGLMVVGGITRDPLKHLIISLGNKNNKQDYDIAPHDIDIRGVVNPCVDYTNEELGQFQFELTELSKDIRKAIQNSQFNFDLCKIYNPSAIFFYPSKTDLAIVMLEELVFNYFGQPNLVGFVDVAYILKIFKERLNILGFSDEFLETTLRSEIQQLNPVYWDKYILRYGGFDSRNTTGFYDLKNELINYYEKTIRSIPTFFPFA